MVVNSLLHFGSHDTDIPSFLIADGERTMISNCKGTIFFSYTDFFLHYRPCAVAVVVLEHGYLNAACQSFDCFADSCLMVSIEEQPFFDQVNR